MFALDPKHLTLKPRNPRLERFLLFGQLDQRSLQGRDHPLKLCRPLRGAGVLRTPISRLLTQIKEFVV